MNIALGSEMKPADIRVVQEDGRALPFTLRKGMLHFFSGDPGVVRVNAGDRELMYSLVLPEIAESKWEPPTSVKRGVPSSRTSSSGPMDLWKILACLGAAGLLADWILYGQLALARLLVRCRSEPRRVCPNGSAANSQLSPGRNSA